MGNKNQHPKYDICGRPVSLRQYIKIRLTELNHLHNKSIQVRKYNPTDRKSKALWEVCWETEKTTEDIIYILQDLLSDKKFGRGIKYMQDDPFICPRCNQEIKAKSLADLYVCPNCGAFMPRYEGKD